MRREEENIDKNHITMSDDERPLKDWTRLRRKRACAEGSVSSALFLSGKEEDWCLIRTGRERVGFG